VTGTLKCLPTAHMIKRWFKRKKRFDRGTARVPDGTRVYAIGDIHGRVDLLRKLHEQILADATLIPTNTRKIVVYLGDYVDRGLESREVIDFLIDEPLSGFECIFLRGNHEEAFLKFLKDVSVGPSWFRIGGDATVYSYGVRIPLDVAPDQRFAYISERLSEAVPANHLAFLSGLEQSWRIGDYLFVHAGVRPGRPLDEQTAEDLLWIREDFLESTADHGPIVIHGHSVTEKPDIRKNRIGIDTGAYTSNVLTSLVLEGSEHRFLAT